jgi:ferredoxin
MGFNGQFFLKIIEWTDNMIVKEWCMYCGECAGVCPRNLIEVREISLNFNEKDCKECEICIQVCPVKALEKRDD